MKKAWPAGGGALVASLLAVLAGCGGSTPPSAAPPSSAGRIARPGPAGPPARGEVVATAGGLSFLPCGAPESRAMILTGATGEIPSSTHPAYAELRGAPSNDGRSFAVDTLLRLHSTGEGFGCDAPVFDGEFVANGNEPDWQVEIGHDAIVVRSPAAPKGRAYPYSALRTAQGTIVYATKLERPKVSTLAVTIGPGRCADSMSEEIRSFKAHVELDGKKLEGCATAGVSAGGFGDDPLDELARWAGAAPGGSDFWSASILKPRLASLLGPRLAAFEAAMQVTGRLMYDEGVFYVLGNKRGEEGRTVAIFLADPDTDTIQVILVEKGRREDFKEGGRDVPLPPEARTMIGKVLP